MRADDRDTAVLTPDEGRPAMSVDHRVDGAEARQCGAGERGGVIGSVEARVGLEAEGAREADERDDAEDRKPDQGRAAAES